tara:strand:- start:426 stop:644 length:219 start_codon:yes stop_codon:yes gene_type:complete
MNLSETQKIMMYDKYIMRGGTDTLNDIQELCLTVMNMLEMDIPTDSDKFNDIITDVLKKEISQMSFMKSKGL